MGRSACVFACKRAVSRVELREFELLTAAVQRRRYPSASRWCTVGVLLTGKRPRRISRRCFLSGVFFLQTIIALSRRCWDRTSDLSRVKLAAPFLCFQRLASSAGLEPAALCSVVHFLR